MSVEIEVVRGKGFPQSEDDPNPCTTQVRVSILSSDMSSVLCAEQCSSVQSNSNAPFFKDVLTFNVPEDAKLSEAVALVKVVELSRRREPFVLLHGQLPLQTADFKVKTELILPLTEGSPSGEPSGAVPAQRTTRNGGEGGPSLSIRVLVRKRGKHATAQNADADVDISEDATILRGGTQLVPPRCEYVWLRLLLDKRWTESFRYALSTAWRAQASPDRGGPVAGSSAGLAPEKRGVSGVKGTGKRTSTATAAAADAEARTIGDVVMRRWRTQRVFQVLTRVRLSAEKFSRGEASVLFSSEEEMEQRTEKKTRTRMLEKLSLAALEASGSSELRDWLERLWVIFAVGIDNDPAGPRTLSYEVRRRVHEATFDDDDVVILQASLLCFFLPSLPFEECQRIAEEEMRATLSAGGPVAAAAGEGATEKTTWDKRVTRDQRRFTSTIISFVGPLIDTLTEAELRKALKTFAPGVLDAHQRIAKGGKLGIKSRVLRRGSDSEKPPPHPDKLGHSKASVKFAAVQDRGHPGGAQLQAEPFRETTTN